jgi:hypothetical protein
MVDVAGLAADHPLPFMLRRCGIAVPGVGWVTLGEPDPAPKVRAEWGWHCPSRPILHPPTWAGTTASLTRHSLTPVCSKSALCLLQVESQSERRAMLKASPFPPPDEELDRRCCVQQVQGSVPIDRARASQIADLLQLVMAALVAGYTHWLRVRFVPCLIERLRLTCRVHSTASGATLTRVRPRILPPSKFAHPDSVTSRHRPGSPSHGRGRRLRVDRDRRSSRLGIRRTEAAAADRQDRPQPGCARIRHARYRASPLSRLLRSDTR